MAADSWGRHGSLRVAPLRQIAFETHQIVGAAEGCDLLMFLVGLGLGKYPFDA